MFFHGLAPNSRLCTALQRNKLGIVPSVPTSVSLRRVTFSRRAGKIRGIVCHVFVTHRDFDIAPRNRFRKNGFSTLDWVGDNPTGIRSGGETKTTSQEFVIPSKVEGSARLSDVATRSLGSVRDDQKFCFAFIDPFLIFHHAMNLS